MVRRDLVQAIADGLKLSPRAMTAQAIRAVLLAVAW
jgi:hypothetical protein